MGTDVSQSLRHRLDFSLLKAKSQNAICVKDIKAGVTERHFVLIRGIQAQTSSSQIGCVYAGL